MERFTRLLRLSFLCLIVIMFAPSVPQTMGTLHAQELLNPSDQKTVQQLEMDLSAKGKSLSQATSEELATLRAGGNLSQYVLKYGTSVFVLNLYLISLAFIFLFLVVLTFTPLGAILGWFPQRILFNVLGKEKDGTNPWAGVKMNKSSFATFMHACFIKKYENNVQAVAFIGTAFLIAMIGLRGVKIGITTHQPDLILMAIIIEVSVLWLLAITTWYKAEDAEQKTDAVKGTQLSLERTIEEIEELKRRIQEDYNRERNLRSNG